ncbi:hypothetical protein CVT25_000009 [Psilocybe cyanescens]|uniref:Uncharacterized protein n=1 Tax=Psilocybe cyanescens TaxID=93625 RepID=A0A409X8D9_PSICY|nr:hypothetical protein CVT25_000009 [Psilocybe cyanescens]
MVKLGPKLPPPTRRELARQEKEAKRAAQIANGLYPAQLGEPREHLALLLAKKTRSKRLETSALEHSWKRWEKNQKRAQARRLAKTLKENISVDGYYSSLPLAPLLLIFFYRPFMLRSQGYGDTSQSAPSIANEGQDNLKVQTIRDDSVEVRIPDLDSTSSEIQGIPMDFHECPLGSETGELSFMSLTGTSLSLSSSEYPEILESPSVSMLPYTSNTPRLGVNIPTGDFWTESNAVSSSSPNVRERNKTAKITPPTQTQGNQAVGKSIDLPVLSSQVPPDVLSQISSLRKPRTVMNAAMTPPRLSSRKGSASSFIFSEPLNLSKYSNRSAASASGRFQKPNSNSPGNVVPSGQRLDTAPNTGLFRGLNSTPRPRVSAYLHPRSLSSADQTVLAKSKDRMYDINDWNSNHVTWRPPAAPSKDAHSGTGYIFGTITAPASLVKQNAKGSPKADSEVLTVEAVSNNVPGQQTQLPASITKLAKPFEPPPAKEQILQELSRNMIANQPESQRNTNPNPTHNPVLNQTVQKHDPFSSDVADAGASVDTQHANPSVISSESGPVVQDETDVAAVLAPAACIIQDKKSKVVQKDEADETEKGLRKNLFNIQPTLKAKLRPSARENGNQQYVTAVKYPDTPPNSWSGIVPPASTPATRSPLIFAMGLPSPLWSRSNVLPRHVSDTNPEAGTSRGFVSALKWVFRKTFGYFWQRRG